MSSITTNKLRRGFTTILCSLVVLIIGNVDVIRNAVHQHEQRHRHSRYLQEEEQDRPPIYTYYHRVEGTGMTEQSDEALLSEWKRSWYNAGWEPKVLSMEDVRKHPDYQAMMDLIVDPSMLGDYELMCYLRWIAMSAPHINGGWLADYDTFPLNPFLRHGRNLPQSGALVVYGKTVPALVSGRSSEYYRLAQRIGESFQRHVNAAKLQQQEQQNSQQEQTRIPWSDMKALAELQTWNEGSFISRHEVLGGEAALTGTTWGPDECQISVGMRAVHISHRAVREGKQAYRGFEHRPTVARQWLNMWNSKCELSYVQD